MTKRSQTLLLLPVLMLMNACAGGAPEVQPSNTPDRTATSRARSELATEEAQAAQATEARTTELAEEAQATEAAATEAQRTVDAANRAATQTAAVEQAFAEATAEARPMYEVLQGLVEEGYLTEIEGTYHPLPDFDESWAQINYYDVWGTGFAPADFVISADIAWDSASDTANWFSSGCGFVFRVTEAGDHYLAFFAMDGHARFQRQVRGVYALLGNGYYGKVDVPEGEASIMLVVEGSSFTFFVNGEKVHSRVDTALSSPGPLAYTLVSGTNKGYGTRCQMEQVELWVLDSP